MNLESGVFAGKRTSGCACKSGQDYKENVMDMLPEVDVKSDWDSCKSNILGQI